jgi:hypothetical protein
VDAFPNVLNSEPISEPTNGQASHSSGETAPSHTNGNGQAQNPFDPAILRKRRSGTTEVKKSRLSIEEGKPEPDVWYRVSSDPNYSVPADILQVKQVVKGKSGKSSSGSRRKTNFYISPFIVDDVLADDRYNTFVKPCTVYGGVYCEGVGNLVWVVRDAEDDWAISEQDAVITGMSEWTRIVAGANSFRTITCAGKTTAPKFPSQPMGELLQAAFKNKFIDTLDHPVLVALRGGEEVSSDE